LNLYIESIMRRATILLLFIMTVLTWCGDSMRVWADDTPPQAPTEFSAYTRPQYSWSVTFYWTPPADGDLDRYEMDVTGSPCESLKETHCGIYDIPKTTNGWTYHNANLNQNHLYYFRLRAVDTAGNTSDWTRTLVFTSTDVSDEPVTPGTFELLPNFPNPFNASTRIQYTLSERAFVQLDIFDLLGRHVTRLIQSTQLPGHHTTTWTGHDHSGESVPSGAYYLRLAVDDQHSVRKMLLLK
jgi:hypothetical protein